MLDELSLWIVTDGVHGVVVVARGGWKAVLSMHGRLAAGLGVG